MKCGGSFPIADWGDPVALRDCAQALDEGGMEYATLSTHIMAMPPGSVPDQMPHHYQGPYREPLILFSHLAGLTRRIVFRTSVMILPLYNTTLLAKQAADLSMLSGGRFEMGVGISWNPREYQALGQDFAVRGRRFEEQVALLRQMWAEPYVTFQGRYHHIEGMGLAQVPPPIPIYIGSGTEERILRRTARIGDGWIPLGDPIEPLGRLRTYLQEEGRDPATFVIPGRLMAGQGGPSEWVATVRRLFDAGVNEMEIFPGRGVSGADAAALLLRAKKVLDEEFG